MFKRKPLVGVVPFGISKDCSAHTMRLLAAEGRADNAHLVLIADRDAAVRGQIATGEVTAMQVISSIQEARQPDKITHLPTVTIKQRNLLTGLEDVDLAASVVGALKHALDLARDGSLDALLVLGDPCRPGDRLAVMPSGFLSWMAQHWQKSPTDPIPALGDIQSKDGLWHLSVLEPAPFEDIPNLLSPLHIEKALELLGQALNNAGFDKPNIAIASLNPRRLGGRLHGTNEANLMGELISKLRQSGQNVFGPWPLDEILVDARDGALDGIVTLHTEQARVIRAVLGLDRAPQVIAGLPIPCVRATWERPLGKPVDKEAEFQEGVSALNMAKMLAVADKTPFRFRGEDRVASVPPAKRSGPERN